MYLAHIK